MAVVVGYLGHRTESGSLDSNNKVFAGGWTVSFTPDIIASPDPCECYHIALRGPSASYLEVWLDETFYSNVARGDKNDFDAVQPIRITPGTTMFFYWSIDGSTRPTVSIFLRTPTIF